MALTVNFSCSQTVGASDSINFVDSSTGTDGAVTQRRIYIRNSVGTFLVQTGTTTEYEVWGNFPSVTTKTLNVLSADSAVSITVQWLNVSNTVLYDKTLQYGFTLYNQAFMYGLIQLMTANPLLINDNDFWYNLSKMSTLMDAGNNAISFASDLFNAQQCYDAATNLRLGSQYFFNGNS